jgi:hypothetical protein
MVAVAVLSGCGSNSSSNSEGSAAKVSKKAGAVECTPAVMVVRHAEDEKNPAGGADILSPVGKKHAELYPKLFTDYLATTHHVGPGETAVSVCPIGKIIAINPDPNPQNHGPSRNPYETIKPLADSLNENSREPRLEIQTKDADGVSYSTVYDWNNTARLKTLLNSGSPSTSTVIAWDKQGLNPDPEKDLKEKKINEKTLESYGFTPLLKALPTDPEKIVGSGAYSAPERTDFYVFTLQDPTTGKFGNAKKYKQGFHDPGGTEWYYPPALSPTNNPNDIRT